MFCEENVRLLAERLTAGVGVGGGVLLPPPPQAIHKPATIMVLAERRTAGRHHFADGRRKSARISKPVNKLTSPAGTR